MNWEKAPSEGANLIRVTTSAQLAEAVGGATPGTTIVLADGAYDSQEAFTIRVKASPGEPVTIRAENRGKAYLTGGAGIHVVESTGVMIEGLVFRGTGKSAIVLHQCHHVRITRNTFALVEDGTELSWLIIRGADSHHNWIDHNEFGPKRDKGMYVSASGGDGRMSRYDVYEYNYFHGSGPAFPRSEGEIKALRIGLSGVSMSDGFAVIQYNLFEHCDANPEIISLKSCHNEVRYNTFRNCEGHLTSRHGHANRFYGNLFIGDGERKGMGGFRIYGNDHHIYENDLVGLTDWAVQVDSGSHDGGSEGNVYTKEVLTAHWRNYRSAVYGNRIVGGPGIAVGGAKPYSPVDVRVTDNEFWGKDEVFVTERGEAVNVRVEGNRVNRFDPSIDVMGLLRRRPLTRADVGPDSP
jgi:nitrous oxidase accessory protein NosD